MIESCLLFSRSSFNCPNSASSSTVGTTGVALANPISREYISESLMCFISIDSSRSTGGCVDSEEFVVTVEDKISGEEDAEVVFGGGAKKMVNVAGPSWSVLRLTVIETAGLWYLSRGR